MSENNTSEMNDSRSFEERVFLRFDAMDARFDRIDTLLDSLDVRVDRLEAKQYDTKPIWEQALASISEVEARLDQLRNEMKVGFESLKEDMENSIHGVEWQIDALNQNILKVQADQRYFDKRLRDVEATPRQP